MVQPANLGQDRDDLAGVLRALRKAAGLSGERLGVKAHMSQGKVSRIETGKIIPTVADVQRILRALEVPPDRAAELLKLARAANIDFLSRKRVRQISARVYQQSLGSMLMHSDEVRCVFPALLPGFLQTPAYVRGVVYHPLSKNSVPRREEIIAAKLGQHEMLHSGKTRFSMLFTEAAVRVPIVGPEDMAEQVEYLKRMSTLPAVDLAIIPAERQIQLPPGNTFIVYDQRAVYTETHAGVINLRDPAQVEEHLELFEYFWSHAVKGKEARELLRGIADEFRARADRRP
ncbi:helix-turn-helix domain-containing protein [Amycolatopsis anabasis]|uniref:helix-turn-helix domain-containing protein n=1 Tax=Amycolatopsis anabasis TaxID=1840409 RepID=UPI00131B6DCA|nr:helix-turn-helix transcriptional regulator [Amycolatopsis anabasis]